MQPLNRPTIGDESSVNQSNNSECEDYSLAKVVWCPDLTFSDVHIQMTLTVARDVKELSRLTSQCASSSRRLSQLLIFVGDDVRETPGRDVMQVIAMNGDMTGDVLALTRVGGSHGHRWFGRLSNSDFLGLYGQFSE